MGELMVSLEFRLHPVVSAVEVIGHRVVHLAPLHPGVARTDVSALAANAAGRNLSLGDVLKCQSDVRGVSSALKSIQDHQITCVLSQRTPRVELLNYTKPNGEELVGLAVELAEDPSGGVQVRVLMDSNVVSGVTVVPLQQGGCCD